MEADVYPAVLRKRLGSEGYAALEEMIEVNQSNLLTVDRFEQRLSDEFSKARAEIRGEMEKLRADIRVDIAERTSQLMKWAMLFWVGQAASVAAIVAALQ